MRSHTATQAPEILYLESMLRKIRDRRNQGSSPSSNRYRS